jgi:hypothetical protein
MKNSIRKKSVSLFAANVMFALTIETAFVVSAEQMQDAQAATIYRTLAI